MSSLLQKMRTAISKPKTIYWKLRFWRKRLPYTIGFVWSRCVGRTFYKADGIKLGFWNAYHHFTARTHSHGIIEPDFVPLWKEKARGANVIYDIGGFNGYYGLIAAQEHPAARVTIFEPDRTNYEQIRDNIALNGLTNCFVENVALSDKDGETRFPSQGTTYSRMGEGETVVQTKRLDDYPEPSLIKMDAAGAESRIIAGGMKHLQAKPPIFLQTDTVDPGHAGMWKQLENLGYHAKQTAVLPTGGRYILE